jgi:hypothetical protein
MPDDIASSKAHPTVIKPETHCLSHRLAPSGVLETAQFADEFPDPATCLDRSLAPQQPLTPRCGVVTPPSVPLSR